MFSYQQKESEVRNLNKTRFITITCWIVTTLVLIGLVAWAITGPLLNLEGGFAGFGWGTFEERTTRSIPMDGIDSMYIDWTSGRVSIEPHDGNDIRITEFSIRELRDNQIFSVNTQDGTLRVDFSERRGGGWNMPSKRLEVLIPRHFENFDDFSVRTVSGRIYISGLNATNLNVHTTSGRVEASRVSVHELYVNTTSGRIEIDGANTFSTNLRTVSGRIEVRDSNAQDLTTRTTSGRHYLSGAFGEVTARSTSGRLEIESSIVPESLYANATSGRIAVTVPNIDPISVSYSITSGRFSSEIPIISHSGAEAQFNLSSTSGRITIYAAN